MDRTYAENFGNWAATGKNRWLERLPYKTFLRYAATWLQAYHSKTICNV
jgi:hypothetical protein